MRNILNLMENALLEGVDIHDAAQFAAFAIAVAEAYEAAPAFDASTRKAWDVLNRHNNEVLFKRIEGSGVNVEFTADDPYGGPGGAAMMVRRMLWDMVVNKHLTIYTGNSDTHPVFSEKDNIIFRTVHDFYTHGKLRAVLSKQAKAMGIGPGTHPSDEQLERMLPKISLAKHGNVGHSFAIRGELNSYSTHMKLAPKAAAPALFTEIIGQICFYTVTGTFADQKASVLPGFDFAKIGRAIPGSATEKRMQEIVQQIEAGAETVQTHLSAKPVVQVRKLLAAVSRNAKTANAQG